ncbi:MAG: hypothetical protein QOH17_5021, partial [Pseudonocardiales bacterium]|nr:hypothetical protein [Pseudonocardiales bacterium]
QALVAEDALRERRWAALAMAQYRCGRQADALQTLRRARTLLREQLGADPGPELSGLEEQMLRHDHALRPVPAHRRVAAQCPYKGLAPLEAGDDLFGRDMEIADCADRLGASPLLVVAGPSGSGKSSLIRAGVVPELRRRGRNCLVLVPEPDGTLRLPAVQKAMVLVVDQLEDILAAARATDEVAAVCSALAAYAERAPVLLAVRADHLGDLALVPALGRLAEQNLHLLSTLAGDALRDAIVKPAEAAGLRLEPGLVELIMRDTEGEPGALPLMSHALVETWRCREGNVLTAEAYRATGGIQGAVARSADRLYESLPPSQRRVLRSVLLRLVTATADGAPTRTRVPSRVLRGDPAREHVLALLIRARLVTASNEIVEISHEALARAWPRLTAWLDEDSAGLRGLRHLAAAADGWDSLGRPDSELYRGARLEAIDEYRQSAHPDLTPVECDLLDASMQHAQTERMQLRRQASLDARRTRRLRVLLAATASLLVVAGLAGIAARNSARDARAARDDARLEALVNRSLALRQTDRDVAALLAIEAVRRWPGDPRARSALFGTFTAAPGFLGNRYMPNAQSLLGARIPHTEKVIVARDGRYLQVRDLDTGELVHTLPTTDLGNLEGMDVAVSGDGRRIAQLLACERSPCSFVLVYNLITGQPIGRPIRLAVSGERVAISDDGTVVAAASARDGAVTVFTADGKQIADIPSLPRPKDAGQTTHTGGVAFGPDGLLYLGSLAGPIRVVEPRGGKLLRTLAAPAYFSNVHLHIGADGIVVAVGQRGMLSLNASTGTTRWAVDLRGKDPDPCPWFAASETAGHLYCGSHYGEIEERSRATGQRTGVVLDTQLGDVGELSLSDDGGEIDAFGADSPAISRWRLDGSGP